MEANISDINHLDADVLLPPRKRLLAGLKKQNCDGNSHVPLIFGTSSQFDARLNNLLRSHSNNPNFSHEEIVEASRLAAEAAFKVAKAARAAAEEKAAMAAKAMASAKNALELVATFSEETAWKERRLKKNKLKKHIPVRMLYNKNNSKTDEELARKLHQAMNSSPRISKNSSTSDSRSHKQKRLKSSSSERTRVSNGVIGNPPCKSNLNDIERVADSEDSVQEAYMVRVDGNTSKFNKADKLKMENGGAIKIQSKEKIGEALEDTFNVGRKRGRIRQKKLPLSICNFRDQANPKEELKSRSLLTEKNMSKSTAGNKPLFSVEPSGDTVMPVERTSMWKCQAFKASTCVKRNKVMQ